MVRHDREHLPTYLPLIIIYGPKVAKMGKNCRILSLFRRMVIQSPLIKYSS